MTAVDVLARSGDPPGALAAVRLADDSAGLHQRRAGGGADIVEELSETGELQAKLDDAIGAEREPSVKSASVAATA